MKKNKPRLLDQVKQIIRLMHYSLRIEETYINWIKRFIFFHNKKHPNEMGEKDISEFITHLAKNKKLSASTRTGYSAALHCQPVMRGVMLQNTSSNLYHKSAFNTWH